jgi:hypothetical protein
MPVQQTPAPGQIFLDHVGWFMPDLEAGSTAFARLGFPLTPFSVHGDRDPLSGELKPLGTANRLAMLEEGYLEFLALHGGVSNPSVERMKASMARHVGVHLIALTVADAAKEAERLRAEGFALNPTINLRRRIEGADGGKVEVAFSVIRPEGHVMPEGRIQMLTQHTPEHMWQARYIARANGIAALREVWLSVTDVAECAGRLSRFTQRPAHQENGGTLIALDRGALRIFTQETAARALGGPKLPAAPAMVAVVFEARNLDATRAFLKSAGITPASDEPRRLLIDAKHAMGAWLVVTEGQARRHTAQGQA